MALSPRSGPAVPENVTITQVLRRPQVARTLGISVLARLPNGAMTLLIVLRLTEVGYAYGEAGIAAAAYGLAVAITSPLLSRVIDRDGQTRVLLLTGLSGAVATVALALLPGSSPLWLFIIAAAVTGALQPPLGGTMRTLWDVLLTRNEERHVGYAVEAGAVELVFTGGPLLIVGGLAGAFGSVTALLVASALTGFGSLAFALGAPSRGWRPSQDRTPDFIGALRSRGVWTLMVVSVGAGGAFGAIEVAVTAFSRAEDNTVLIGVLLAVWSIGSLLGGLVLARLQPASDPARRILLTLALLTVGNGVLGLGHGPWVLGILLFFAGGAIAPTFATANAVMGSVAPTGTLTEAFAFTMGAVMIGLTIGSPVSGFLVDHVSVEAALSFSGVPPALAALVVMTRRGTLSHDPGPGVASPTNGVA
ncbi:MAG: MFS transporter [Solirubrobacteraceae bacterium]|nr:MFS transporter [Solirubrobacteraceae bacterium]